MPTIDVGLRIRVHDEEIDPAVVVVVESTQPASGHRRRVWRDTEAKRTLTQVEPDPTGDVRQANPFEARARGVARDVCRRGPAGGGSDSYDGEARGDHQDQDSPCEAGDIEAHRVE